MLALDVDSDVEATRYAKEIGAQVGAIKVGPRLIVRYGAKLIQDLAQHAPIFLDHKFFDIPSTMVGAIQAAFDAGATFATIHAGAGAEALQTLSMLEKKLNDQRTFKILCVTILTSFDQAGLPPFMNDHPVDEHVSKLAALVAQSDLNGIVCSPHEISIVKSVHPGAFIVTPGIRPGTVTENHDDQKRIMTPAQAMLAGASALVIGRPILQAQNPKKFIDEILNSIEAS